jgi:MFS transporter, DHA1 family, multidrug resistance protein
MANPMALEATTAQAQRTQRRLWLAIFWVSFPFGILSFVLPVYGRDLGASALEIGALFSALALVPVFIRPFLGRLLDRWGRRPFLLLGFGGYLLAMLVFSLADQIWILVLGRLIQGLGQALLWLTALTVVADTAGASDRGLAFGAIDEATNRGAIVGTTLGFTAIFTLGQGDGSDLQQAWPILLMAYAVPALVALFTAWRGVPETRLAGLRPPVEGRRLTRPLGILMGIVFLTGASAAMVWPLLMVFLEDSLGVGIAELAFAYLPAALIGSVVPSRAGRLADRFGRRVLMAVGLLIGAVASALIPQLQTLGWLAALWAVESVGYAASVPAERAYVADIAGEDTRGASYGLYTFAYFLGMVVGPLVGGWLYDNVLPASPFYLNSVFLVVGAILVWTMLRVEPRPN